MKLSFKFFAGLLLFLPANLWAFYDISVDDPQAHIFQHLKDVGIMGRGTDNFFPNKTVTRAEALTIALRSGGIQIPAEFDGQTFFNDIDPNSWYAPVISRGVETKIILNKAPNFRPDQAVTKAEFLAFLFRATGVRFDRHFETQNIALDILNESWFKPHFSYAKKYQIAHLPPDNFYRPYKPLTRREVAIMTFRQLRIFHGSDETRDLVELQAAISQFLSLIREGKNDKAEFELHRILTLNEKLTRTKNNADAVAARSISRAMKNLAESLRQFRYGRNLAGIERLHLASKYAHKAEGQSENIRQFAVDLQHLISELLVSLVTPQGVQISQR